jgi:hypothetical protein
MLVPEHLTTIVNSLDSWSSRSFRELYEGIRPRTPDAIGLAFTPTNLIASWVDTAGSLQMLKQPVSPEYRQLYERIAESFIYENDYYHSHFSNGYGGDLMTIFELVEKVYIPINAEAKCVHILFQQNSTFPQSHQP